jgi:hypothetical protein
MRAVRASGPMLTSAPLTVMVNEHTASASEIFAGALHDNCRALIVGTRSAFAPLVMSEMQDCFHYPVVLLAWGPH